MNERCLIPSSFVILERRERLAKTDQQEIKLEVYVVSAGSRPVLVIRYAEDSRLLNPVMNYEANLVPCDVFDDDAQVKAGHPVAQSK